MEALLEALLSDEVWEIIVTKGNKQKKIKQKFNRR